MARSTPTPPLGLREINRATLARQMLLAREQTSVLRGIERLVALQAQWPRPPFVGLWSRLEGFQTRDLATLLGQARAVRGTLLRGTLHLASARDYLAFRPVLQPVLDSGLNSILKARKVRLDLPGLLEQAQAFLANGPRTFEEIRGALGRAYPRADDRAMGYAVRMSLPLVMAPEAEASWSYVPQSRFGLAESWLKASLGRTDAPDALVLRYLAGYGPATIRDIQAWSGLPGLASAVERLRPRLVAFRGPDGRELLDLPDAPRPGADVEAPVRFVPEYDNLIATRTDERFVAKAHRPRIYLSALRIAATLLVDGFVVGTWKVESKKGRAVVTVTTFKPLPARTRREVEQEAEALARFTEPSATATEVGFAPAS